MDTLRWRSFSDREDGFVDVTIYETPFGKECIPDRSKIVSAGVVTRDRAVEMLRDEPVPQAQERASDLIDDGYGLRARGGLVYFG
jgi:hypothetical protein